MGLTLIGAGFGRTGTLAAKIAIERLGLGRCYHMSEVFSNPSHAAIWSDAADGRRIDWDALFAGFAATVDWPGCRFWRQLSAYYPQAKVLLTVRDSERWYQSAHNTIFAQPLPPAFANDDPVGRALRNMMRKVVDGTFGGHIEDRRHAIEVYERHNEEVRRAVPAERLLVYDVAEGWAPLCRFLSRPIPDEPFPKINSTAEFRSAFGLGGPSSEEWQAAPKITREL